MPREKDIISIAAKIATDAHADGKLSDDELIRELEICINARAAENGYADKFGVPFPRRRSRP